MDDLNKDVLAQEISTEKISFLVHDLLDFAQIKARSFKKNIQKFNLIDAIE